MSAKPPACWSGQVLIMWPVTPNFWMVHRHERSFDVGPQRLKSKELQKDAVNVSLFSRRNRV